jgi:hypothetical protein
METRLLAADCALTITSHSPSANAITPSMVPLRAPYVLTENQLDSVQGGIIWALVAAIVLADALVFHWTAEPVHKAGL